MDWPCMAPNTDIAAVDFFTVFVYIAKYDNSITRYQAA